MSDRQEKRYEKRGLPPIDESLNAASDRKYTRDKGVQQMKYEKREVPLIDESLKAASDRNFRRGGATDEIRETRGAAYRRKSKSGA